MVQPKVAALAEGQTPFAVREDAELFDQRVEDPQHRAQQRDALGGGGWAQAHPRRVAKDLAGDRPRQVDLQAAPLAALRVAVAEAGHILLDSNNNIATILD